MTQPANPIPRAYDAGAVERRIYQNWWDSGYFAPHANPSARTILHCDAAAQRYGRVAS